MKSRIVLFFLSIATAVLIAACGNSDVQSGTVTEKRKSEKENGKIVCSIMVLEDREPGQGDPLNHDPVEIKLPCNKAFDDIKIGQHWERSQTS